MQAKLNLPDLITILGPTATGKTALAAALAAQLNSEVISADSRQVYRGMNLGTGKDYEDYIVDGRTVPYHLIDIVEAGSEYSLFEYQRDFLNVYEDLRLKGKMPILCGGSGLYLDAVLNGYRLITVPFNDDLRTKLSDKSDLELIDVLRGMKKLHNVSDTGNRKRLERAIEIAVHERNNPNEAPFPAINAVNFGIQFERSALRDRITERLRTRRQQGLIEEVQALMAKGVTIEILKYYGLEYRYVASFLTGELSRDEMFGRLDTAIHQFAKRQMTWFRKMERHGTKIHWLDGQLPTETKVREILDRMSPQEFSPPLL
jgi:tRNA dimethylallyltransferase